MHKASLLDVTIRFHAFCFSLLALMSSPCHLPCFLKGLRVLARVVTLKSSSSQCWCLVWHESSVSLLRRSMLGVQVPFCRAWGLAAPCPMLSAEGGTHLMCLVGQGESLVCSQGFLLLL